MKAHTVYKTFNGEQRREFIRITEDVQAAVDDAGVAEGFALVSMHITAGVWVNDDESGLHEDTLEWIIQRLEDAEELSRAVAPVSAP